MEWFTDWFTVTNVMYAIGLILLALLTLVSIKYRIVIKELREVAQALEDAYEDGKLTKKEKEKIMKEVLDVIKAVIGLFWKFKLKP